MKFYEIRISLFYHLNQNNYLLIFLKNNIVFLHSLKEHL